MSAQAYPIQRPLVYALPLMSTKLADYLHPFYPGIPACVIAVVRPHAGYKVVSALHAGLHSFSVISGDDCVNKRPEVGGNVVKGVDGIGWTRY